jgi:outer membrane protein insertion porin family
VPDSQDQVDVNFTIKEKPTGAVLLGAGFSTTDRLILQGSIQQTNIFGSGKHVGVQVSSGKVNRVYSLSYTDPYFTIDGVSQGFDIYKRDVDASSLSVGAYKTKTSGGGLRFGYPLSDIHSIGIGFAGERVSLETFANSPFQYLNFARQFGTEYTYGSATLGWTRDTLDSGLFPTQGSLTRIGGELAGGDLEYYRATLQHQTYWPLSRTFTLIGAVDLGQAEGNGGKPLPFFKNFYAGGTGSVRGYRQLSLGPQDAAANVLGGGKKVAGSLELQFPVPGAQMDRSLRLAAFIDAGQVYAEGSKVDLSDLRYSAGVGLAWSSPFGPLRLSLGNPLNAKPQDRKQRLQFTFGTGF